MCLSIASKELCRGDSRHRFGGDSFEQFWTVTIVHKTLSKCTIACRLSSAWGSERLATLLHSLRLLLDSQVRHEPAQTVLAMLTLVCLETVVSTCA
ncbi:hypothetical protein K431DRAFT_101718 [Polychaeton citri CBS 116435]|uniref:Uncharacterized protein n=1 Tax=Polychaeton citri CBS 116435 TaxID=1314669 RepID=A0A9P4UP12_9PEZI|nr:hypothetical protein K431DRAFT_101718 [Polychaeton citri CBS 116435]